VQSDQTDHSPVAGFRVSPARPSTADTIQLSDQSHDPGDAGIAWRAWDFGDGSTAVGSSPMHRYLSAGRYAVTLTLATFDGRVGAATREIEISESELAGD
jgi:PKD repeat protein